MKLNKHLPKYTKKWTKTISVSPILVEEGGRYLVFEKKSSEVHNQSSERIAFLEFGEESAYAKGLYFFEIFKYIKKIQQKKKEDKNFSLGGSDREELIKEITKHLLRSFQRKTIEGTNNDFQRLTNYLKLVSKCFDLVFKRNMEISLVIQKKIGYKYYENITYI